MSYVTFHWNDYNHFPYEKRLARREVEEFLGARICEEDDERIVAELDSSDSRQISRLTYFRYVEFQNGERLKPTQAVLESSSRARISRQSTRYSAHGLHEYRGKFNPQIVRAAGNLLGMGRASRVLDPYCGSGTTLLEGRFLGWDTFGTDMNPLAVFVSNAKIAAASIEPERLESLAQELLTRLEKVFADLSFDECWNANIIAEVAGPDWLSRYEPNTRDYLQSWFPISVLAQLVTILGEIEDSIPIEWRDIFRVVVSDIARSVSLQDPGDLRVRRRKDPAKNYDAVGQFSDRLEGVVDDVAAATRTAADAVFEFRQRAIEADVRQDLSPALEDALEVPFDGIITSPPYATALPYIDTQRLSLCLLGLAESSEISDLEHGVIGSREIRKSERDDVEEQLLGYQPEWMPAEVVSLCREMLDSARLPGNGFRRRAKPAVVYRYFRDLALAFQNLHDVVRKGGSAAFVVGRNTTTLGETEYVIDTPHLLGAVAESNGWQVTESIDLDTYPRYDVHQANSIRTEQMILLHHT